MSRTIAELTDIILTRLADGKGITWREFWVQILDNERAPDIEGKGYYSYVGERLRIKDEINNELVARKDARRLVPIYAKGLQLVNSDQIAEAAVVQRLRKSLRAFVVTINSFEDLMDANNLPDDDKRMLHRLTSNAEWEFNSYLGACLRMRCLPDSVKSRLLTEFQSE